MKLKKIVSVLLTVALIFTLTCFSAFAEDEFVNPYIGDSTENNSEYATDSSEYNASSTESYTAPNGYSYDYMVPNLDMDKVKYEHVYDFAGLLTDEQEKELSEIAAKQGSRYGIALNFVTYDDAFGKSTTVFTDDFYDYYVGMDISGILFAVDMDNRQVYINTVGTAIRNIDDDEIDDILDSTFTYAKDGNYYGFFINTLDKSLYAYANGDSSIQYAPYDYGDEYGVINSSPNKFIPTGASLIFSAVVTVVVVLIMLAVHNKNNRAPSAANYMDGNFRVLSRNEHFIGVRHEVLHDYYKPSESSGGGGGSSHSSGGGGSHGGGGHSF